MDDNCYAFWRAGLDRSSEVPGTITKFHKEREHEFCITYVIDSRVIIIQSVAPSFSLLLPPDHSDVCLNARQYETLLAQVIDPIFAFQIEFKGSDFMIGK